MTSKILEKILVPIDGSKYSKKAVDKAIEIANEKKTTIYLLMIISTDYVLPPGSLLGLVSQPTSMVRQKLIKSAKKNAAKILSAQVSKCQKAGINAKYIVETGNASEKILMFSKKKKISLIVIGAKGLHGIEKLNVLGSTSRKISELATCPVLIIR